MGIDPVEEIDGHGSAGEDDRVGSVRGRSVGKKTWTIGSRQGGANIQETGGLREPPIQVARTSFARRAMLVIVRRLVFIGSAIFIQRGSMV
jgi:hypothetical protein